MDVIARGRGSPSRDACTVRSSYVNSLALALGTMAYLELLEYEIQDCGVIIPNPSY